MRLTCSFLAIGYLESENSCLSDVVEAFNQLSELFENIEKCDLLTSTEQSIAKDKFTIRCDDKFITKYNYLANYLDPRYQGHSFKDDEDRLSEVYDTLWKYGKNLKIIQFSGDKQEVLTSLTRFINNDKMFGNTDTSDPCMYWMMISNYPGNKKLAAIAIRLSRIPSSSAGVERSFSIQKRMHSEERNRLKKQRVDQMMRIKYVCKKEVDSQKNLYRSTLKESKFEIEELSTEEQSVECESEETEVNSDSSEIEEVGRVNGIG